MMKDKEIKREEVEVSLAARSHLLANEYENEFDIIKAYNGDGLSWDADDFVTQVKAWIDKLRDKHSGCHRFEVRGSAETDYDSAWVDKAQLKLVGFRWETDEEFEKRKATTIKRRAAAKKSADKRKAKKEAAERKRLAELKEKYE